MEQARNLGADEKKSAAFIPIRPLPNMPYPISVLPYPQYYNQYVLNIEPDTISPESLISSKKGHFPTIDDNLDDPIAALSNSKQQRSYEELKVSIVLCGEYLSTLFYAEEKSINIHHELEESLKCSLESSLDINLLTSISSKRKKDIIVTGTNNFF